MDEQFFFDTEKIFGGLNPKQREAVNCLNGPLLVMAGAGSGKTRVLTCRIANLIAQGIAPWNILAITFTNKAANEMKSRAAKMIGESAREVWLSTFHSFCAQILRREIDITGKFKRNFAIYDASDSKALVKQCVNELKLSAELFANANAGISALKNDLVSVDAFKERALNRSVYFKNLAMIYEMYQNRLQQNNALDFDDLIFFTVKIFSDYPEVLERYQERFQYILIDEYQDTNAAQYELTRLLAAKYKNICVVGDADQSIYGWRGADMRNIMNFERDYPKATVVLLEQNYRSTKTILRAANAVIANNDDRIPKNLWTQNDGGERIKLIVCESDRQEAQLVAREIRRLVESENFRYDEIALLYRMNAQSRPFEEYFMQMEIPYVIVGGLKFYDRKEIKDILAYLHVIANPNDSVHLRRIINTPRRGLGQVNVNRLMEYAEDEGISVFELVTDMNRLLMVPGLTQRFRNGIRNFAAMMMSFMESAKTLPVHKLIQTVLDETGYMDAFKTDDADESKNHTDDAREENLGEFINSAKAFVQLNPDATVQDFLNHVALINDTDAVADKESRVKLMTVHSAKGLEFPVVFVVGMEEKIFPHGSALDTPEKLEEERRACYVALTRAERKLYITAAATRMFFGEMLKQKVSRFVDEMPADCMESYGYLPERRPVPQVGKLPARHVAPKKSAPTQRTRTDWNVGDQVNHKLWGLGTVMDVGNVIITVQFANPQVGVKKLAVKVAPITKI